MNINPYQLIFAREYRGYSQTELSKEVKGLSQPNLSKFEKGLGSLSDDLLLRIISFLDFPPAFFLKKISNRAETEHYRKKSSMTKKVKTKIEHDYRLMGYIIDQMSDSLYWPDFTFDTLDIEEGYTPSYVAKHARKTLKLQPNEPVREICALLENNGIIIIEMLAPNNFDGVSFVTDEGTPIIVINKNFTNDRKRFTIAHELGHLLMHSVNTPPIPKHRNMKILEEEANLFASEFLMPKENIVRSLYNLRLSSLAELKRYWLTSMASILRRAKDLNCIDSNKYKYLNIEFSRRGLRRDEGLSVFIDEPVLFRKAYSMHKIDLEYSDDELAKAFNLPLDVIKNSFNIKNSQVKLRIVR